MVGLVVRGGAGRRPPYTCTHAHTHTHTHTDTHTHTYIHTDTHTHTHTHTHYTHIGNKTRLHVEICSKLYI